MIREGSVSVFALPARRSGHGLPRCEALLYVDDPLVGAAAEYEIQTPLRQHEGPVHEHVQQREQLFLLRRAPVAEFLEGIARVARDLIALAFELLRELREARRLREGLAAGKGDAPTERIGPRRVGKRLRIGRGSGTEFPGLRVLAALAAVRAALRKIHGTDAGTVNDGIADDPGHIDVHPLLLLRQAVLDAVALLGLFRVVPLVHGADKIAGDAADALKAYALAQLALSRCDCHFNFLLKVCSVKERDYSIPTNDLICGYFLTSSSIRSSESASPSRRPQRGHTSPITPT